MTAATITPKLLSDVRTHLHKLAREVNEGNSKQRNFKVEYRGLEIEVGCESAVGEAELRIAAALKSRANLTCMPALPHEVAWIGGAAFFNRT